MVVDSSTEYIGLLGKHMICALLIMICALLIVA